MKRRQFDVNVKAPWASCCCLNVCLFVLDVLPSAPSNLVISNVLINQATIRWDSPAHNPDKVTEYRVCYQEYTDDGSRVRGSAPTCVIYIYRWKLYILK